jgi:hypothetical protein
MPYNRFYTVVNLVKIIIDASPQFTDALFSTSFKTVVKKKHPHLGTGRLMQFISLFFISTPPIKILGKLLKATAAVLVSNSTYCKMEAIFWLKTLPLKNNEYSVAVASGCLRNLLTVKRSCNDGNVRYEAATIVGQLRYNLMLALVYEQLNI